MTEPQVKNNQEQGRFQIELDGDTAVLEYRVEGEKIIMPHTQVPSAHRGKGYGEQLARAALDYAREQSLEVVPLCPFVKAFIESHPEYQAGSK